MSVFTTVTAEECQAWLANYAVGQLVNLQGIAAGIENTNYFVTTQREDGSTQRFVLTIFEILKQHEIPFYLHLMAHLAAQHVPVAAPIANHAGDFLGELKGKPACLVACLTGKSLDVPHRQHCAEIGTALAKMHLAGQSYSGKMPNPRGAAWRSATLPKVLPFVDAARASLLQTEVSHFQQQAFSHLPRGIVHCDLFRDNALFDGDAMSGMIDFYFACEDVLLYDVAITVNDWCINPDGCLDTQRVSALLTAYQQIRTFTAEEQQAWQDMLCLAALRFWLSRLFDQFLPRAGEMTFAKDPDYFYHLLQRHRQALPLENAFI